MVGKGGFNAINKIKKIREKIKEELIYIPRGNIFQNFLRQIYWNLRIKSLGHKKDIPNNKKKVLQLAIKQIKEMAKNEGGVFVPQYDKEFFIGKIQ